VVWAFIGTFSSIALSHLKTLIIIASNIPGPVQGRLLLVAAAVLWSVIGVAVKSPLLSDVPGPVFAGCRALTAGLFLLPLIRPSMVRFRWGLLPLVGSFASMNILFIIATQETTAAAAIFLQNTASLWAMLFGVFVLRERVVRGNVVALMFGLTGIAWIVYSDWQGEHFDGNTLALLSGIAYAGVILSLRALRDESPLWLIFLCYVVSGGVLCGWIIQGISDLTLSQWAVLACVGPIQMGLPYVLFARSLKSVSPQEASLILLIEPLLNPTWVWLFCGEAISSATATGGGLILFGLALRYTLFREKECSPKS
jgi:DME family drug/metabolite transporter